MNVYLDMVGCRLNQAELESIARHLRTAGHCLVSTAGHAELVIINTCTVTGEAASDSRQKIRQAARAGAQVVVTGCWSELEPDAAAAFPGVSHVIPNAFKDQLVGMILGDTGTVRPAMGRIPLTGNRQRTRAFIKVQDGCDNHCTFCVTRLARGRSISRPIGDIIDDIRHAIAGGAREAVLTGVQIGSWGREWDPAAKLSTLLEVILAETDIPRLRISSIEPWEVDDALIAMWQEPRLCRHIHLPLQSGSASLLKRMARRTDPAMYGKLVEKIRKSIPGVSITTDVIVGFPGECEKEFDETRNFITTTGFSGGHVFLFSGRPGTAAVNYPDQVPHVIRRIRSKALRDIFDNQAAAFQKDFIGQQLDVLWERSINTSSGWISAGLSDNYLKVTAATAGNCMNTISPVMIQRIENSRLIGEIAKNE
ncbi:MAG: MiaB/RimO family radical SAM methylthiotransferase [Anaerolineaceae bacterium]|nr:MiaB/RimO family radical SAM methylthiotransferase [Anaerolineaceae bacterium]